MAWTWSLVHHKVRSIILLKYLDQRSLKNYATYIPDGCAALYVRY